MRCWYPNVALAAIRPAAYVLVVNREKSSPAQGFDRTLRAISRHRNRLKPNDLVVNRAVARNPRPEGRSANCKVEASPAAKKWSAIFSKFFIEAARPFQLIAILMVLIGGSAFFPSVCAIPDVVPPTVQVTTLYPGASRQTRDRYRALPIEQQVPWLRDMLYMPEKSPYSGADGT